MHIYHGTVRSQDTIIIGVIRVRRVWVNIAHGFEAYLCTRACIYHQLDHRIVNKSILIRPSFYTSLILPPCIMSVLP